MKRRLTILWLACIALVMAGSGTMWGQAYENRYVSSDGTVGLRRLDATTVTSLPAYIGGANNIGGVQFGAGESLTIEATRLLLPLTGDNGETTKHINIGSAFSKNIVMNNYNAGGKASGFLNITATAPVHYNAGAINIDATGFIDQTPIGDFAAPANRPTGTQAGLFDPGATLMGSAYNVNFSPWYTNLHDLAGPMWAKVDMVNLSAPSYKDFIAHLYLSNHVPRKLVHWGVKATEKGGLPYTTTRGLYAANDSTDNGINLVASVGQQGIALTAAVGNATVPDDKYIRPTTIAVKGVSTFDSVHIHTLEWYLKAHNLETFPSNGGKWYTETPYNLQAELVGGCGHVGQLGLKLYQIGSWVIDTLSGPNKLDAAVQILNGARVCVTGNVTDFTGGINELASADAGKVNTNAVIVLPGKDRMTLRTYGNFKSNMAHEKDSAMNAAAYYTEADFPDAETDIYLYASRNQDTHLFNDPQLGGFSADAYTKYAISSPPSGTTASIFGVHGDYLYEGKMAEIHTDTIAGTFDGKNAGTIEVGPRTAGKDHYHVYSSGILKNFESCNINTNFTMNFGDNFGKTPEFKITQKKRMYILNYGNNAIDACPADIHLYGGATQALETTFANAADEGDVQIQAISDVELRADAAIDATSKSNNLYILSDGGNVVTQAFSYKAGHQTDTARGLLTLWAEDRLPERFTNCANDWSTNRNSNRGNVYINDNMKVERPAAPGSLHTETNMIAANNIRTASFEFDSENLDHDTTNIISRKGDVWLGYSIGAPVYNATGDASSNGCNFSNNKFTYSVNKATNAGELNIKAGWDETDNGERWEGGNIYFTTINAKMFDQGTYPTNITIPFSNEYYCGSSDPATGDLHERKGESMQRYEHAGIIGGVGRCGQEHAWAEYEGKFTNPILEDNADVVGVPSLKYKGNNGNLTVDAGQRGNIIMNTGTELDFQNNKGSAFFRTRFGDIDLRNKTDVSGMQGSLLLLAQRDDLRELSKVGLCGCAEERNNVYLQDFQYTPNESSGSIFIGADNNIKLNYGGLQNKGTRHDPFLSTDYNPANPGEKIGTDYPCRSGKYHCDMVDDENQARPLMLDFTEVAGPAPIPITQGGFAAVASDYIDVYKTMNYKGGSGSGMSSVPGTGTLHGENVAGYGLYMKTQGNKNNWNTNILKHIPKCPMGCEGGCDKGDYLHMVSRMTFHSDARIFANGQKVYLGSPVIEVFGDLELNTEDESGNGTEIVLQADSLILHDSLIVSGNKLKYRSWSGINGDKPIMKFGYSRRTPPVQEYKYKNIECAPCYSYIPGSTDPQHMLDTITIKFKQGDAYVERLNTAVFDHTVLTFVTDSFDHAQGPPILDARFFIDTMKVRNQVVLYADKKHTRNAHFELISEEQKQSKDYAGLYVRHYHMEPVGACGRNYSELWLTKLENKALDVITTSTFGGFGYQHSDVHVEIKAHLSPGFTSLRLRGQCYEQKCGTLKMKDLRLDGGAQLHFSVGTTKGINGEYSDAIDVEKLTTYGTVDVNIEVRPCERMMNRCYPIIYYKSQTPGSLKNLNLVPKRIKIDGEEVPLVLDTSTEGVVYVCVGNVAPPTVVHSVTIPSVAGVTTTPPTGIAYAVSHSNFEFKAKYSTEKPFVVRTNRMFNGETEVLEGKKNSNGEYEYVIRQVTQNIVLKFGPDYVANMSVNGTAVWSHGETIYIRVEREDIASIYSVAGQLVKRVELPEGDTPIPMQRGVYVVTLKDGSVHKVIVK